MTFHNCKTPAKNMSLLSGKENTACLPMYKSVRGSLSVGYHCLNHCHAHLLCRVTHREERKPPAYISDWAKGGKEGQEYREREGGRERLQALAIEIETLTLISKDLHNAVLSSPENSFLCVCRSWRKSSMTEQACCYKLALSGLPPHPPYSIVFFFLSQNPCITVKYVSRKHCTD